MIYLIVKALHLIFVIAWIASLLIFPRYKLHQQKSSENEILFETLKEASIKLRKIIMTPAMLLVWGLGITLLVLNPAVLSSDWIHLKLALVLGLSGVHGYFVSIGRRIDAGDKISDLTLKLMNEVPFVVAALIILLAVIKPF